MRPARRSTRWRACWGCRIPAGRRSSGPPRPAIAKAHRFPRPLLDDPTRLDFSFSGLKTAVRYLVAGPGKLGAGSREQGATHAPSSMLLAPGSIADIAASFQEAVIDCLVGKAELALERTGYRTLCVGGGVAANRRFRERLEESAAANGYELHVPPLCALHRQRRDGRDRGRAAACREVRRSVARHPARPGADGPHIARPSQTYRIQAKAASKTWPTATSSSTAHVSESGTTDSLAEATCRGARLIGM